MARILVNDVYFCYYIIELFLHAATRARRIVFEKLRQLMSVNIFRGWEFSNATADIINIAYNGR